MKIGKRILSCLLSFVLSINLIDNVISINSFASYIYRDENYVFTKHDEKVNYALELINHQNSNRVRNNRTKREMIEYLLYSSQYAVFDGEDFPIKNESGNSASYLSDKNLSIIDGSTGVTLDTSSRGCMAYSWFASGIVYSDQVSLKSDRHYIDGEKGSYDSEIVKNFFKKNLQAGEHIRVSDSHSMTYISCDDDGFYYLEYPTSDDRDSHIRMSYAYFEHFVQCVNLEKRLMWIYEIDKVVNDDTFKIENGVLKGYTGDAGSVDNPLIIPNGVTTIGEKVFMNNTNIVKVEIPGSVKSIWSSAFEGCSNLETVVFNEGLETIGSWAFSGCVKLNNVTLPDSVKSIGSRAFFSCYSFTEIHIPRNVSSIGVLNGGSFLQNSMNMAKITVDDSNQNYKAVNNILFTKDGNDLCYYPPKRETYVSVNGNDYPICETTYRVPNGVKRILGDAFVSCDSLRQILLSDTVYWISIDSITNCSNLTDFYVTKNITNISPNFRGCNKLENIRVDSENDYYKDINGILYTKDGKTLVSYPRGNLRTKLIIPEGVTDIGDFSLEYSRNLKEIILPSTLTHFGSRTFWGCYNLEHLIIPNSVNDVPGFSSNNKMEYIYYLGSQEKWNSLRYASSFSQPKNCKMIFTEGNYCKIVVACPVNVEVYNSSGELVGSVTDNVASSTDDSVLITVDEDTNTKYIHTFGNEIYDIRASGYDSGTMDYFMSVQSVDDTDDYHEYSVDNIVIKPDTVVDAEFGENNIVDVVSKTGSNHGDFIVEYIIDQNNQVDKTETVIDHNYSDEWKFDEVTHWHECDCGKRDIEETHSFDAEGKCTICGHQCIHSDCVDEIIYPTKADQGYTTHTCNICGYVTKDNIVEPAVIAVTSSLSEYNEPVLSWNECSEAIVYSICEIKSGNAEEIGNTTGTSFILPDLSAGTHTYKVTAYYDETSTVESDIIQINVPEKTVTDFDITAPTKTSYYINEPIDLNGGTISVSYNRGETKTIKLTNEMLGLFSNTVAGDVNVDVTYGGITKSFSVTIKQPQIIDMFICSVPQTVYSIGDELDLTGGKIEVWYEYGEPDIYDITADMVSGYNPDEEGEQSITVSYQGFYDFFLATVKLPSDLTIEDIADQTYSGSAIAPDVVVKEGDNVLTKDTDYTVEYSDNTNVGEATVTVTGIGSYSGTKTAHFNIVPKNISNVTIADISDQTHTGMAIKPIITVTDGSKELVLNTDYTVAYSNNTDVGTAAVTITGTGNYTGTKQATFEIVAAPVSKFTVSAIPDQIYTGNEIKPTLTVKDGSKALTVGTDYTATYSSNTDVGNASVTVTGKGSYAGATASATFKIVPKNISSANIATIASQVYTRSEITPAITVTDGTQTLLSGTDYSVSYTSNTNVGTATVTVSGKGNYSGTKEATFEITAKDIITTTVSEITDQEYTGFEIKPSVTVKDGATTLSEDTDYTVSYSNNTDVGTATVTITGKGNYKGTTSVQFKIVEKPEIGFTVEPIDAQTYTGVALEPAVTVKDGDTVLSSSYYSVEYTDNINVGTATVTVTGKDKFAGVVKTVEFEIVGKSIQSATVSGVQKQVFTGTAITLEVSVKDGIITLKEDVDYTVGYENNINAGTATILITGIGNYLDTKRVEFEISPKTAELKIAPIEDQTYTGSEITPNIIVKDGDVELTQDTDYTVKYKDNLEIGTATVTVNGKGNYIGTATATFEIVKSEKNFTVDAIASQTYTGSEITPEVTVKSNDAILTKDTDYTVEYSDNINVGEASVIITGIGTYKGTVTSKFNIDAKSIDELAIASIEDQTFTGEAITPSVTIKYGEITLIKDTDYTVTYTDNTNAGKAAVTIIGTGNYTGNQTVFFNIIEDKSVQLDIGNSNEDDYSSVTDALKYISEQLKHKTAESSYTINIGESLTENKAFKLPKGDVTIKIKGGKLILKSPTITANSDLILDCEVAAQTSGKLVTIKAAAGKTVTIDKFSNGIGSIKGTKTSYLVINDDLTVTGISTFADVSVAEGKTLTVKSKGKITGVNKFNGSIELSNGSAATVVTVENADITLVPDNKGVLPKVTVTSISENLNVKVKGTLKSGTTILTAAKTNLDTTKITVAHDDATTQLKAFLYKKAVRAEVPDKLSIGGKPYPTFEKAFESMTGENENYTITLNDNVTVSSITLPKQVGSLTINGGKEIIVEGAVSFKASYPLTIENTKISAVKGNNLQTVTITANKGLTLKDIEFNAKAVTVKGKGNLTLGNCSPDLPKPK